MNFEESNHFVFLLIDDFTHLAFACALEPLRIANHVSGKELYKWTLMSENGMTQTASCKSVVSVHQGLEDLERDQVLFVIAGLDAQKQASETILSYLKRQRRRGVPMGGLCAGAYFLARAGFLQGVTTAIHWDYHDSFIEEFSDVNLSRQVFVADDAFITASGGTATADLMLHLIEQKHGSDLCTTVADQMVYNAVREPTANQRVSLQSRYGMRNEHLLKAVQLMEGSLEAPLLTSEIASEIGLSTRQVERLFGRYLNCSPTKYMLDLRMQRARHLLLQTEKSITEIAMACGFSSHSHFSRVYKAHFGTVPSAQRTKLS